MPLTNLDTYRAKQRAPHEIVLSIKNAATTVIGRKYSLWGVAPNAGATPTTAAVPTSATAGALGQRDAFTTALRILFAQIVNVGGGCLWLCDRLSHQGGLSGTSAVAQTTNLPTAALSRHASGAGVRIGLEIYSQIGVTPTTISVGYTNQAGTAGRTAPATAWGNTGFREAFRFVDVPLQLGDTGVRSVENVTAALSTGTAGNFGVTLYKPLLMLPVRSGSEPHVFDSLLSLAGTLPEVTDGSCLFWLIVSQGTSSGMTMAEFRFAEDDT